jgi:hypothetical protein
MSIQIIHDLSWKNHIEELAEYDTPTNGGKKPPHPYKKRHHSLGGMAVHHIHYWLPDEEPDIYPDGIKRLRDEDKLG